MPSFLAQCSPSGKMSSPRSLCFVECGGAQSPTGGGSSSRVVELRLTKDSLYQYFRSPYTSLHCKIAVLHMAAIHDRDHDLTRKVRPPYITGTKT